jgi:hypothetical protein
MLRDDIVSHGLVAQCTEQGDVRWGSHRERVGLALTKLLGSGQVEIGVATLESPQYVTFVAWKGTVDERVRRALAAVEAANAPDKEYAYWLCLREDVDRFEGEEAAS